MDENQAPLVQENLISPSIDSLLEKVENKYLLALLTAKRARDLFEGSEQLVSKDYVNKVTTAIHEIHEGKVTYEHPLADGPQEDHQAVEEEDDDDDDADMGE
ncbi:MAG: DNA-directed RNA polymerase subunit omega [Eubacteriaceae bacterium]|nr:DNA-directed RNA polymerase subunit omega [Eubacteriaceae bacterium]